MVKKTTLQLSIILLFLSITIACSSKRQAASGPKGNQTLTSTIEQRFKHAAEQYKLLMDDLHDDKLPKTFVKATNYLETSGPDWWTSGFYPGTLWYLYEETHDAALKAEAQRAMKLLTPQQKNQHSADLGMIMYNSFGTAMKIDPQIAYQKVLLASAKTLMKRYNPKVKAIRSWDTRKNDQEFVVVIDHIMNLELLFWATHATADSSFYRVAEQEGKTIWNNLVRPDYSTEQIVTFDTKTGQVKGKRNAQAYQDTTTWARGQAWALYGFTVLYRETKNKAYLQWAEQVAGFILNHPNLPKDKIPYWDFNAPDIPHTYRDASAGAIMAAALLELSGYSTSKGKQYFKTAETMLETLASPDYTALLAANGGFILMHGAGYIPVMAEVDVPLPYADYYYMQALKRYKAIISQSAIGNAAVRYP